LSGRQLFLVNGHHQFAGEILGKMPTNREEEEEEEEIIVPNRNYAKTRGEAIPSMSSFMGGRILMGGREGGLGMKP
jgi:hypothetical protein